MKRGTVTVGENRSKGEETQPRFVIRYSGKNPLERSRKIISAIKQTADMIMTLNTAQMPPHAGDGESFMERCIGTAREYSVEYRYHKVQSAGRESVVERLFGLRKSERYEHEACFLITDAVWHTRAADKLRTMAPLTYYILRETGTSAEVLDSIQNMMDGEKRSVSSAVIFDWPE
ncbi:MAG: hypothetical protein ACOCWH_05955, partial [Spirochaetota bacterium]